MTELEMLQSERERIERANAAMRATIAMAGIRIRSPEEIEQERKAEEEREKQRQAYLAELFLTGEYEIYKRSCPTCGTVFYTTNYRRVYDDYYMCSRYVHRANAKKRREDRRATICLMCGKQFTPARAGGKYCSNACKQKAYRSRVTENACGQNDHMQQA